VIKSSTNGPYLLEDMGIATKINVRADLLGPNLPWIDHNNNTVQPDRDLKYRILQGIELQGFQTGIPNVQENNYIHPYPYGRGLYCNGDLVEEYESNLPTGKYYRIVDLIELKGKGKGGREASTFGKYSTPMALGWFDEDEDGKYICLEKDMLMNFEYVLCPCPQKFMLSNFPYELAFKVVNNKKKWKRRSDLM